MLASSIHNKIQHKEKNKNKHTSSINISFHVYTSR